MLTPARVILSLTPDALDGALVSGRRVVRVASTPLDRAAWRQAWSEGLLRYDEALAAVLASLRAGRSGTVTVIAQSPTQVVDVCTVSASAEAAVQAGVLRVTERVHSTGTRPAADAAVVATDVAGAMHRAHVLAAADDDMAAQAVFGWVGRAGWRLSGYVPRSVIPMHETVLHAAGDDSPCVAWCFLDKGTTALAAMDKGELLFMRSIEVGYQAMSEAYARGLQYEAQAHEPSASVSDVLDLAAGTALLFEQGVPARDAKIGQRSSHHRRVVGPLLAPVVQRLSVEIKQTLRYGVGDPERRPRRLLLVGPGAAIPGMATLLTESTELDVEALPPTSEGPAWGPFARGSAEQTLAVGRDPSVALLPLSACERLGRSRRTSAIRAGVIVVAGLLAGEAGLITLDRQAVAQRIDAQREALDAVRQELTLREQAFQMGERLDLASYLSAQAIGDQPDWSAALLEIATLAGEAVTCTDVRTFFEGSTPVLALGGIAKDPPGRQSGAALGEFIERLNASPLIAKVDLGTASNLPAADGSGKKFSVRCTLHALPLTGTHEGLHVGRRPAHLDKGRKKGRP